MIKRIFVLILILLLGLSTIACGKNSDVPEGMQAAHQQGEPFRLYVPDNWTLNEGSGISGAFYFAPDLISVSARYQTPAEEITVEQYLAECAAGYALTLTDFVTVSIEPAVLGGADAQKLTYTMILETKPYTGYQICTLHEGDMISLNIYLPTDALALHGQTIADITANFVLAQKAEPKNDEVTDKHTPDGMKIASHDKLEYRLYVPKSWICDSTSKKTEAYYPESGNSNVSVTSYSPDTVVTVSEHWASCKEAYAKSITGFTLVSEQNTTVANKDAVDVIYLATYEGVTFRLRQVFLVYREMVYTITYTALPENFDTHSADVDRMISEFHFR